VSACAAGDGLTVEMLPAEGWQERHRAMAGEMGRSLRKGLLSIAAAGPSTDAGSAGAAADNTDQDIRIPAGWSNLHHHYTDSLRTASKKIKSVMG
jgi:hypothetical protein